MIEVTIEKEEGSAVVWLLIKHENSIEGYRFPLMANEIRPVLEACKKYLEDKN